MEVLSQHDLQHLAHQYSEYTLRIRRHLHMHPELAWQEEKTIDYLLNEIETFLPSSQVDMQLHHREGGFFVDVNYADHLPRILLRADLDALPIKESTDLPFKSQTPGVMHACGHDCHTAMLLTSLKIIAEHPLPLGSNLRFVFQRAEEVGDKISGGRSMCIEGVCDDVEEVFALHLSTLLEAGTFSSRPGVLMANSTVLSFVIDCSGGHVMHPNKGDNAIDLQTDINIALRGFDRKVLGPSEVSSFAPSISNAGVAQNVRPSHLEMTYAFRNFAPQETRTRFIEAVRRKVKSVVAGYETARLTHFESTEGYPVLVNDESATLAIEQLLKTFHFKSERPPHLFCSEDFSYYLKERKGSYWMLGAMQNGGQDHHTPHFNPDESILWIGTQFWLSIALHYAAFSSSSK